MHASTFYHKFINTTKRCFASSNFNKISKLILGMHMDFFGFYYEIHATQVCDQIECNIS